LPTRPIELLKLPLIHVGAHPWESWLRAAGVEARVRRGTYIDDSELALQAAVRGHGIALGRASLVGSRLRDGTLVAPFAVRIPSPFAYYLVYPERSAQKAAFRLFRGWLLDEIAMGDKTGRAPRRARGALAR
jgi:LysR family glycine cleavage system transcriptional activator